MIIPALNTSRLNTGESFMPSNVVVNKERKRKEQQYLLHEGVVKIEITAIKFLLFPKNFNSVTINS